MYPVRLFDSLRWQKLPNEYLYFIAPLLAYVYSVETTEADTLSNIRQRRLKFRCETLIEYESQKCKQAVQGGLLGGHRSTSVKHKHILFPPACSSSHITEALPSSWPGQNMRTDNPEQQSQYSTSSLSASNASKGGSYMSPTSQARLNGVLGQTSMYYTFLIETNKEQESWEGPLFLLSS